MDPGPIAGSNLGSAPNDMTSTTTSDRPCKNHHPKDAPPEQDKRQKDTATMSDDDTNSFAAAQQRLAARRQAREAENAARAAAQRSESQLRARIEASQSPLLRRLGSSTLSFWDAISTREGTRPAFRVGQVDAELLDEELVELLRGQVGNALRYVGGGAIKDDWHAEILLALRAVLFKLSVWDHDATYGAALQNLKYTDARHRGAVLVPPSRMQKSLYGIVTVGGDYLWTKWEDWLRDQDDGHEQPSPTVQRLSRWTSAASTIHAGAALVSFVVFLLHGRYRTLLDRVLRMRLAPPTSQVSREVSFEYLNRQLVWHAFTEFLLFVLPLVGINRWRRWLTRWWRKTKQIMNTSGEAGTGEKKGEYAFLPERTCAICYQDQNSATTESDILAASAKTGVAGSAQTDITNPYETIPCGCVYCFVCLATRIEREEGEGWSCLRCGELVKECKPWAGDVLEPPTTKSPTAKTVVFADDVKPASDDGEEDESRVLVDLPPTSIDELDREVTPETETGDGSDDADTGSDSSDSEDYEAEEDELGDDLAG
ncbi:Pex12 amino terminal region-domain-containing protein [Echria macrotheca]|uniref:Pex12 amino terminal region-domain-containing protein n=1 Tax=Echria macrotheca TaxID=438768 RepID=A0AAJ0FBK0_9PEZI|nr:Pex12 amino terminal region-domain-containing protein [Echria macrotheca]